MSKARLCLTFDVYRTSATTALPIMQARGLVGTAYHNPHPGGGDLTVSDLVTLSNAGWEVGGYMLPALATNMTALYTNFGPVACQNEMSLIQSQMTALGFPVTSFAPTQRAWSPALANLAHPFVQNVRCVTPTGVFPPIPVNDPYYEINGSIPSLSTSDTLPQLTAFIDALVASGGLGTIVTHNVKVSPLPDAYAIDPSVFTPLMDYIQNKVVLGQLDVLKFSDAMAIKTEQANVLSRAFDHLSFDEDTFDSEFWDDIVEQPEIWMDKGH